MYLIVLIIVYNVFHYYINKRKEICKIKHVQGIMLTHINQSRNLRYFMLKYVQIYTNMQ